MENSIEMMRRDSMVVDTFDEKGRGPAIVGFNGKQHTKDSL